jgi:hypothetical protein
MSHDVLRYAMLTKKCRQDRVYYRRIGLWVPVAIDFALSSAKLCDVQCGTVIFFRGL